jgi:DNA replication protein
MKWYEQKYLNHRDWILDNCQLLGMDDHELVMVMLIDFFNEHHEPISMELLHQKTGMTLDEVDRTISVLCAKKYLEIRASASNVCSSLNGLCETDVARSERILDSSLFSVFEKEFGRTLSNQEMEKISDWNRTTDKKMIIYALREASAYQKLNVAYIDRILNEWKNKGLTIEQIEEA